jgi:hypothetical protein
MAEKVHKVGLVRGPGYRYFLDKDGDILKFLVASKGEKKKAN